MINVFVYLLFLFLQVVSIYYEVIVFMRYFSIVYIGHLESHNSLTTTIHLFFYYLSKYIILDLFLVCFGRSLQYQQLTIELVGSHTLQVLAFVSINMVECYFLAFFERLLIELHYFTHLGFPNRQLLSIILYMIYFELYFRNELILSVDMVGNRVTTRLS